MTLRTNIDGVDRDMTEAEETAYLAWQAEKQAIIAEKAAADKAKAIAKKAALAKLGLTEEELNALLG